MERRATERAESGSAIFISFIMCVSQEAISNVSLVTANIYFYILFSVPPPAAAAVAVKYLQISDVVCACCIAWYVRILWQMNGNTNSRLSNSPVHTHTHTLSAYGIRNILQRARRSCTHRTHSSHTLVSKFKQ